MSANHELTTKILDDSDWTMSIEGYKKMDKVIREYLEEKARKLFTYDAGCSRVVLGLLEEPVQPSSGSFGIPIYKPKGDSVEKACPSMFLEKMVCICHGLPVALKKPEEPKRKRLANIIYEAYCSHEELDGIPSSKFLVCSNAALKAVIECWNKWKIKNWNMPFEDYLKKELGNDPLKD